VHRQPFRQPLRVEATIGRERCHRFAEPLRKREFPHGADVGRRPAERRKIGDDAVACEHQIAVGLEDGDPTRERIRGEIRLIVLRIQPDRAARFTGRLHRVRLRFPIRIEHARPRQINLRLHQPHRKRITTSIDSRTRLARPGLARTNRGSEAVE
jgi:hypothetical protein